tara:strand:+ start:1304 stop:2239 length:936 start_codon:yes stop_codon:yes gene_type:complete
MECVFADKRVYVAGHRGMVGQALIRSLEDSECKDIVTASSKEVDLREQLEARGFLSEKRPDIVIVSAAKVGGIHANDNYPAEFIYDNLMISANLIDAAYRSGVERLLFLGSSCIYPKYADQPISEDSLLSGSLEPTNEAYAIAKIAGLKLCEFYRKQYGVLYHSAMPCNLYGVGDNYHPENSHVIPALIRRFNDAMKSCAERVVIWGSGTPRREFLYADDLANACLHLLNEVEPPSLVNIGAGEDLTILELAREVAKTVGFEGEIVTDPEKPDGTPRKLMDSSLMRSLGWSPTVELDEGLRASYRDYLSRL